MNNRLKAEGGGAAAIIDDNYIIGTQRVIFEINAEFAGDFASKVLESRPSNVESWNTESNKPDEWDELRGDLPERILRDKARKSILVRLPYTPWRSDLRPLQAVALGKGPERAEQQNLTLRVEDAEVVG